VPEGEGHSKPASSDVSFGWLYQRVLAPVAAAAAFSNIDACCAGEGRGWLEDGMAAYYDIWLTIAGDCCLFLPRHSGNMGKTCVGAFAASSTFMTDQLLRCHHNRAGRMAAHAMCRHTIPRNTTG